MPLIDKISRALGLPVSTDAALLHRAVQPVADPSLSFDWTSGLQLHNSGQTIGVKAGGSKLGTVVVPDDGFYEVTGNITIVSGTLNTVFRYIFQIIGNSSAPFDVRWLKEVSSGWTALDVGTGAAQKAPFVFLPIMLPVFNFFLKKGWEVGWFNNDAQGASDSSSWDVEIRRFFVST
jgi:hypothetical protein